MQVLMEAVQELQLCHKKIYKNILLTKGQYVLKDIKLLNKKKDENK
jgi:hypothetical protein